MEVETHEAWNPLIAYIWIFIHLNLTLILPLFTISPKNTIYYTCKLSKIWGIKFKIGPESKLVKELVLFEPVQLLVWTMTTVWPNQKIDKYNMLNTLL